MNLSEAHVTLVTGLYFRMKFVDEGDDILGPARHAEGRSHHDGQRALYLSGSRRGTIIASRRYIRADDRQRAIFPLSVSGAHVVDLRNAAAAAHFGIDLTHRAAEWQTNRERGLPSPTWGISDRVRVLDLDGMLYASRSEPRLMHLTLFRWN